MPWDDAPSHICRGGDVRALAFCCPPVKPCPIVNALKEVDITPQEYIEIKNKYARETRLGEGPGTSVDEYLSLKKQMAEELVGKKSQSVSNEDVTALTSAFDIDEEEAKKILNDCGNDLRKAIKLLRVKTLKDDS